MKLEKVPIYEQVKVFIRTKIKSGDWVAGNPVPSESAFMHQFGVSRMTVNRALRELMAEGVVRRVQGSGTFAWNFGTNATPSSATTLTVNNVTFNAPGTYSVNFTVSENGCIATTRNRVI